MTSTSSRMRMRVTRHPRRLVGRIEAGDQALLRRSNAGGTFAAAAFHRLDAAQ